MALVEATGRAIGARRRGALGVGLLGGLVVWWTWRALNDPGTLDAGLAYNAGQVAWATGHPEVLPSWDGTPFLVIAMAGVSRVMGVHSAVSTLTVVNTVLVVGTATITLRRLRGSLPAAWWWLTAFALLSFGPMMSSLWWKQFNIVALVLALAGFESLRTRRHAQAAALIGLSIAIKPLIILLPFVLLIRRETRRAGLVALGWVAALNFLALSVLASRAHDLSVMNPYRTYQTFAAKGTLVNGWGCLPENFAPGSLLCRVAGPTHPTVQHLIVWLMVALLGAWVITTLRDGKATSWEVLAFTLPLSAMVSPLAWSHYQVVLGPLLVLLLVRFAREGAGLGTWAGLALAYVLTSLLWQPYGSLVGALGKLVASAPETSQQLTEVESVAQFAQYAVLVTGILWYRRQTSSAAGQLGRADTGGRAGDADSPRDLRRAVGRD